MLAVVHFGVGLWDCGGNQSRLLTAVRIFAPNSLRQANMFFNCAVLFEKGGSAPSTRNASSACTPVRREAGHNKVPFSHLGSSLVVLPTHGR